MRTFEEIFLSNKAWSREMRERKSSYFAEQTGGQKPEILWIGCSDSRVSPEQITQSHPGEMLIHRNIANLAHGDDENLNAVVQVAVDIYEVKDIVICGHYGCGGIQAAMDGGMTGAVDRWLQAAREVEAEHAAELAAIEAGDQRVNRMVELNVREQLIRLSMCETVTNAFARGADLTLHGLVYDLRDGLISQLLEIDGNTPVDAVELPDTVLVA